MVERIKLMNKPRSTAKRPVSVHDPNFLASGSVLLDLVLGGGWGMKRIANLVGDRSSGKTLLAIEALANFAQRFDPRWTRYGESEAALETGFAHSLGMPTDTQIPDEALRTVEEWDADIRTFMKTKPKNEPGLYILDSLDALSDEAEMKRDMEDETYGGNKAKKLSEMFRKIVRELEQNNVMLMVISQLRDNIGARFGEKYKRSGGKALDFYCSQIVWLAELGKIQQEVLGVKRPTGIELLARTKKNKVGLPFRQTELTLTFGYGIDDETSMLNWLRKNKATDLLETPHLTINKQLKDARKRRDIADIKDIHTELKRATMQRWEEIEAALRPTMSKY